MKNRYLVHPKELFVIETNNGIIHINSKGEWFLGGNVDVAAFKNKKEANLFRRKVRRERPDLIDWTRIKRISVVRKR